MAELELADWKYLRSFRLIAMDPHAGGTSFVDLTFRRPNNGGASACSLDLDFSVCVILNVDDPLDLLHVQGRSCLF